jgi:hypothetical protein
LPPRSVSISSYHRLLQKNKTKYPPEWIKPTI